MKFYCIYDNLYEEYQMPFTMKNDNIAKIEFEMFVNNAVDKAPEKEKAKTRNRFILCQFNGLEYDKENAIITKNADGIEQPYSVKAEPMTIGEEEDV